MDNQLLLQQYDRSESCRLTIRMKEEEEEEKEKIDILPDSVCLNERKTANKQTNKQTHTPKRIFAYTNKDYGWKRNETNDLDCSST